MISSTKPQKGCYQTAIAINSGGHYRLDVRSFGSEESMEGYSCAVLEDVYTNLRSYFQMRHSQQVSIWDTQTIEGLGPAEQRPLFHHVVARCSHQGWLLTPSPKGYDMNSK